MLYESESLEFKQEVLPNLCKSVIAFANTNGGKIIVGLKDDGKLAPLDNLDQIYTQITNTIRDAILPDITMFIKYSSNSDGIITIEIAEGSAKPYYLKSKGLKPSGVYVRQGASSVPASPEQIRYFIKATDGDTYEAMRSLSQELTFNTAYTVFSANGITFSENKYSALGLINLKDNLYTNLGLLLSDQCQHSIKIAVFEDRENTKFQAHREFSGSLLQQLEAAYEFLMLCNQNRSTFAGLSRIDSWDYPLEAVREALLNAIIHRDYSYSGSIIVNINKECMEFISLGGLLPELTLEDIQAGISQPRNVRLAELFHRLNFIEAYGTGIRRIFALYKDCYIKPQINITQHTFKIILPNKNRTQPSPKLNLAAEKTVSYKYPDKQQQTVITYLKQHQRISETELQQLLDVKRTRAYLIAREMMSSGLLAVSGRGSNKYYYLP